MPDGLKKQLPPFEHLVRVMREDEARRLSQCIEEIDHRLLDCRKSLEEYRRVHSALGTINRRLSRLGAEPLSVPNELPTEDLGEIIKTRIDHFKSTGKM